MKSYAYYFFFAYCDIKLSDFEQEPEKHKLQSTFQTEEKAHGYLHCVCSCQEYALVLSLAKILTLRLCTIIKIRLFAL